MITLSPLKIEEAAKKAGGGWVLTPDELKAIIFAHVPTSSDGYAEILKAINTQYGSLDHAKISLDFEEKATKQGARNLTLNLPVVVTISGVEQKIPVEVTTNVDVTLNKENKTTYDITHTVKINGKVVEKNPTAVQTEVDKVTGQLVSWAGFNTKGEDKLVAAKEGRKYSATLTDSSSDPIVQGGKVYRANIIGMTAELKAGDSGSKPATTRGYTIHLTDVMAPTNGDQYMAKTLDTFANGAIEISPNKYIGLLDTSSNKYVMVTEL